MDILQNETSTFIQKNWKTSGFTGLTDIQHQMIPEARKGGPLIAEAPTGTGKTLGYLIPALERVVEERPQTQVLIIVPGKELAMQVHEEVQKWTVGSGIRAAVMIGGANVKRQYEKLKKKPHVITGTPGRVNELIKDKKLKVHEVSTLVFDEADQLFVPDHLDTIDQINKAVPGKEQRIICSATIPERVVSFAEERFHNIKTIRVEASTDDLQRVSHLYLLVEKRDKVKTLSKLSYLKSFYGIAFLSDSFQVDQVHSKLQHDGNQTASLHGDKGKQGREKAMRLFRQRDARLLLTTDVASRGLDVKGVTHVIHFDLANDQRQYMHRAGRTARAGESGISLSIVTKGELQRLEQIAQEAAFTLQRAELKYGELHEWSD